MWECQKQINYETSKINKLFGNEKINELFKSLNMSGLGVGRLS